MIASLGTMLMALIPQQYAAESVRLDGLPSAARLGQVIHATLRIETRRRPGRPTLPEVEGLEISTDSPWPNRSMIISNGRVTTSVSTNYLLRIKPVALGRFTIPPITVQIGTDTYQTKERVLDVVGQPSGESYGSLELKLSRQRVYVHEPIRFDVQCAVDRALAVVIESTRGADYYDVSVDADWLTELPGAEPIVGPETDTKDTVNIVLNRALQVVDSVAGPYEGGRSSNLFRFRKSFLPIRAGVRRLAAPVVRFSVDLGGRRDPFSRFRTRNVRQFLITGEPVEFEVLPLPSEGRPDPYYGAVGRFSISAALDKRTVMIGGSVKLTLTISGEGNTRYLQAPDLPDIPGFHMLGQIANPSEGTVIATYDLTPQERGVHELPGIEWNFFDTTPGVEEYVTLSTEPQVVEVLAIDGEKTLETLPGAPPAAVQPGVDDIYDLKLSSEHVPVEYRPAPEAGYAILWVLTPWILCFVGWFSLRTRRRILANVQGRRARRALRGFKTAAKTGAEPVDCLVDYLADRLGCEPPAVIGPDLQDRLVAAGVDPDLGTEIQSIIEGGVASRYGGEGAVDRDRVFKAVESLERVGFRSSAVVLVLLVCLEAIPSQVLAPAEKAYRDKDFASASEGFRERLSAGDRMSAYNLGNAQFREGRYGLALAAYEQARLAMPRDPELLANIALVKRRLLIPAEDSEGFGASLEAIRHSLTAREWLWLCVLSNALAGGLLFFGGRRLRSLGVAASGLAGLLVLEVVVWSPGRPPWGIVVSPVAEVRAEPDRGLQGLMRLREGFTVEILGASSEWTAVRVDQRTGYLASVDVVVIE